LSEDPFSARQTPENEVAYERLMDVRLKLYVRQQSLLCFYQKILLSIFLPNFQELSYEIDLNHDSYMEFMQQCLDTPGEMRVMPPGSWGCNCDPLIIDGQ